MLSLNEVAGAAGFEPAIYGTKNRCLTIGPRASRGRALTPGFRRFQVAFRAQMGKECFMRLPWFQPAPSGPTFCRGDLVLRPFHLDDADNFAEHIRGLISDPKIEGAMLTFPNPFQLRHARARIRETQRWIQSNRGWSFAIIWQGALVGQAQIICARPRHRFAEIAYWLAPEVQGQGLAFTAMDLLLEAAVDHWPLEQIEATVVPGNAASISLLHRLGFTYRELAEVPYKRQGAWWRQTAQLEIYERAAK